MKVGARVIAGVHCLLVVFALVSSAFATQVRQLNIEDLTRKAGTIVAGRCTRVEVVHDPDLGRTVTRVTILAERSLKGPGGRKITFRMIGDRTVRRSATTSVGLPTFSPGEEIILFLYPDSAADLTSPVGLGQGKFVVRLDKQGRPIAVNAFGSHGLTRGMSAGARNRLGEMAHGEPGRAAPGRDALLQMIERLANSGGTP